MASESPPPPLDLTTIPSSIGTATCTISETQSLQILTSTGTLSPSSDQTVIQTLSTLYRMLVEVGFLINEEGGSMKKLTVSFDGIDETGVGKKSSKEGGKKEKDKDKDKESSSKDSDKKDESSNSKDSNNNVSKDSDKKGGGEVAKEKNESSNNEKEVSKERGEGRKEYHVTVDQGVIYVVVKRK